MPGPGGGSSFYTPTVQRLDTGESFSVDFRIGLAQRQRFGLFVDLYGRPELSSGVDSEQSINGQHRGGEVQRVGRYTFAIDEGHFIEQAYSLYLPLIVAQQN